MNIIECQDVDLIEPFPPQEIHRIWGWIHCYKTINLLDGGPTTAEEFNTYMANTLSQVRSWGVIDKNNKLNVKHEAPLIGAIMFEPSNEWGGYFHVASTRKAWGSRMIDQGGEAVIQYLFETCPELLRVGAYILEHNAPARGLAKRLGFRVEGYVRDLVMQGGEPKSMVLYGLTRRDLCPKQQ